MGSNPAGSSTGGLHLGAGPLFALCHQLGTIAVGVSPYQPLYMVLLAVVHSTHVLGPSWRNYFNKVVDVAADVSIMRPTSSGKLIEKVL